MSSTHYARFHPVVQTADPYTMAISYQHAIVPFLTPTPPASDVGDSAAGEVEECVGCKMIREEEAWRYDRYYQGMYVFWCCVCCCLCTFFRPFLFSLSPFKVSRTVIV